MSRSLLLLVANCLLAIPVSSLTARGQHELPGWVNAQLPWQKALVDDSGRLLAWYHPEKYQGYDKALRLAWDFMSTKCRMTRAPGQV